MSAVVQSIDANTAGERELTDGFNLMIDALKLNGLTTIYGVPASRSRISAAWRRPGIRVVSFRHEQNAGNAASIAGFLTKKPGVCLTVSAPGFLNGLTALAHATTNCFPMILISARPSARSSTCSRATMRRWINSPLQNRSASGVPRAACRDIGIGLARAIRAAVSGRRAASISICRQAVRSGDGRRSRQEITREGDRRGPCPASGADAVKRALDVLKNANVRSSSSARVLLRTGR